MKLFTNIRLYYSTELYIFVLCSLLYKLSKVTTWEFDLANYLQFLFNVCTYSTLQARNVCLLEVHFYIKWIYEQNMFDIQIKKSVYLINYYFNIMQSKWSYFITCFYVLYLCWFPYNSHIFFFNNKVYFP